MPLSNFHHDEHSLVSHLGIFRSRLNLWQATGLLVSGTVGAGIFALPYAAAQSGFLITVGYLAFFMVIMGLLYRALGDLCAKTKTPLQLPGLARHYLGGTTGNIVSAIVYLLLVSSLFAYLFGVGIAAAAIWGGSTQMWSMAFFIIAMAGVSQGLRTIKSIELTVFGFITLFIGTLFFHSQNYLNIEIWHSVNWSKLFFPYGIVLFALHGISAVPEAFHVIKDQAKFPRAIINSSVIVFILYFVFIFLTLAVTGNNTTQIATLGLGQLLGPKIVIAGNLFAIFCMSTSFLLTGVALRDSLRWDFKLSNWQSNLITAVGPLVLFVFSTHSFFNSLSLAGGILISLELVCIVGILLRAKSKFMNPVLATTIIAICLGGLFISLRTFLP